MSIYGSIVKGLNEAIEYEKGTLKNVRKRKVRVIPIPNYKGREIKKIRETLELTQTVFADLIGVSVKTVEAWEAGRNIPRGPAQRMLEIFKNENKLIEKYVISK